MFYTLGEVTGNLILGEKNSIPIFLRGCFNLDPVDNTS